jgi:hypothetical protein
MRVKFTPEEQAEIELMLWEYDRDGHIAIENFFRRVRGYPQEGSTRPNRVPQAA